MYPLSKKQNPGSAFPVLRLMVCMLALSAVLLSCTTVPYTGRSQLLLVPESEEIALGNQAYQQVLTKDQAKISKDPQVNNTVNTIGRRIAAVANRPDYNWQFTVIKDDKTANAFALPGGKVAIYTGILPYTKNDSGLAFVMAHEIAHAIARHGGERMSQQLLAQLGQQGLNAAIANQSPVAVEAINTGYGLASQVGVILPFSRTQEYEADRIGLIFMAKAGYDPREAPGFFERMMHSQNKQAPMEFLSTHPADQARIQRLRELMPEALQYYRK